MQAHPTIVVASYRTARNRVPNLSCEATSIPVTSGGACVDHPRRRDRIFVRQKSISTGKRLAMIAWIKSLYGLIGFPYNAVQRGLASTSVA